MHSTSAASRRARSPARPSGRRAKPQENWSYERTVWYSFTPTDTARVTFESSAYVVVFSGSSYGSLVDVGARLVAGTTYLVNVSDYIGRAFTLSWSSLPRPANDDFADAALLSGYSGTAAPASAAGATAETQEPSVPSDGYSVWYAWTAPVGGQVTFKTLPGGADNGTSTYVYVYTGSTVSTLQYVNSGYTSTSFTPDAGVTYRIQAWYYCCSLTGNVVLDWTQVQPDATTPTVTLTQPADGATVWGTVTLSATASDPGGNMSRVEFWIGTTRIGTRFAAARATSSRGTR